MLEEALESVSIPGEMRKNKNRAQMLLADKGYDSISIRNYLRSRRMQAVIPARSKKEKNRTKTKTQ
jgi:IS5 family transposase